MEVEELLKSNESMESIIQNNPSLMQEAIKNDKFKEKLYKYIAENGLNWNFMRGLTSSIGENGVINNLDVKEIINASNIYHKDTSYICIASLLEGDNSSLLVDKMMEDDDLASLFYDNIDKYSGFMEKIEPDKRKELFDSNYSKYYNLEESLNNSKKLPNNNVKEQFEKRKEAQKYLNSSIIMSRYLDEKDKYKILDGVPNTADDSYYNKDYNVDIIKNVLYSNPEIAQNYINNNPRALYMYKDLDVIKLAQMGVTFPSDIINQKDFFEKIKSNDMVEFRQNVNLMLYNNNSFDLKARVEKYEENILDGFDKEKGIFSDYDFSNPEVLDNILNGNKEDYLVNKDTRSQLYDYAKKYDEIQKQLASANKVIREQYNLNLDLSTLTEKDLELIQDENTKSMIMQANKNYLNANNLVQNDIQAKLKELSANKFKEMFADYAFEDTRNNATININELVNYNKKLPENEKIIADDKEKVYSDFANLDKLSANEQYELYTKTKDKKMYSQLYTDTSKAKENIYKEISNSIYDVSDNRNKADKEKSIETGLNYHKMNGQKFYMLVRALSEPYKEDTRNFQDSYTLISNDNLSTFNGKYVYCYGKFDPESIMNTFEVDSFTMEDKEGITDRPNRLLPMDELIKKGGTYCEINIKNKESFIDERGNKHYKALEPNGIISMGTPDKDVLEEAKRFNGNIVEIDERAYSKNKEKNEERSINYSKEKVKFYTPERSRTERTLDRGQIERTR